MNNSELFEKLLTKIDGITNGNLDKTQKLHEICRLLKDELPAYEWVGFYLVSPEEERQLVLGPYIGDPTDHVKIAFGQGICGQAADSGETFIVDDVSKEDNYLSCSINVRSEIVVPLFNKGKLVGELDIDSHTPSAFTDEDDSFLKKVGEKVAHLIDG